MGHYVHYIGGGIVDSKIYETGNAAKSFKSPMKELKFMGCENFLLHFLSHIFYYLLFRHLYNVHSVPSYRHLLESTDGIKIPSVIYLSF